MVMKVDKISVTYSRKFNLGNYESLELSATLWVDLEPDDDVEQALQEFSEKAKESVKKRRLSMPNKGYRVIDAAGEVVSNFPYFIVEKIVVDMPKATPPKQQGGNLDDSVA